MRSARKQALFAVDDILAKGLRRRIDGYPKVGEFQLFGSQALGNNVQILHLPTRWIYEALEGWMIGPDPKCSWILS